MATAGNISGSEFATEFVISIEDRGSPTRVHGDEDIAGSHHERLAVRGVANSSVPESVITNSPCELLHGGVALGTAARVGAYAPLTRTIAATGFAGVSVRSGVLFWPFARDDGYIVLRTC
jgi:hypothetical protein